MAAREPAILLELDLPCDSSAPHRARDAIREVHGIEGVRDQAILIASELVANAVTHSGADPRTTLHIDATLSPNHLRIAVLGPGHSDVMPATGEPPGSGIRGLGLRVVEQISERWGVEEADGRRVWATLAL